MVLFLFNTEALIPVFMGSLHWLGTVAEITGDHSNFLKLKEVIFYTKFKGNIIYDAYDTTHTCMYGLYA